MRDIEQRQRENDLAFEELRQAAAARAAEWSQTQKEINANLEATRAALASIRRPPVRPHRTRIVDLIHRLGRCFTL